MITMSDALLKAARIAVLFVDGNDDSRLSYESVADANDFVATLASDGAEARAIVAALLPSVIVVDEEQGGFDVLQDLRDNSATGGVPVVFVGCRERTESEAEARALGCDLYLVKPVSSEDLVRAIHELAGKRPPTSVATASSEPPPRSESRAAPSRDRPGGRLMAQRGTPTRGRRRESAAGTRHGRCARASGKGVPRSFS